jgi:GR25 family glycosyltransferase involved in LPS biosynthesis
MEYPETENLGKSFVISLKGSRRRKQFHERTGQFLSAGYEFFDAIDTRKVAGGGKQFGCILSHRTAIQRAKDEDLDFITVFEDDATFVPKESKSLESLCYLPEDAGLVFLSNFRWGRFRQTEYFENLTKLGGGFTCCHAMQYRKPFYDIFLDRYPGTLEELKAKSFSPRRGDYRAIDRWMNRLPRTMTVWGLEPRPFLGNWCHKEGKKWRQG